MPNMADITVKKYDNVTDILFTASTPSGTDGSKALWLCVASNTVRAFRHSLECWSVFNGPKTARKVFGVYKHRVVYTDSTTGLQKLLAEVPIEMVATIPLNLINADIREAIAVGPNLFVSALFRSSLEQQNAPT